jgi:hypothetical protein
MLLYLRMTWIRKVTIWIIIILAGLVLLVALLYIGIDQILVPRYLLPEVKKQIAVFNISSPLKIALGRMDFDIWRGFHFEHLSVSAVKSKEPLLKAGTVDLDLRYWPLLKKQVIIKDIKIQNAELRIERNRKGLWSFTPLLKMMEGGGGSGEAFSFEIERINCSDSKVIFADQFSRRNQLKRQFEQVDLSVINAAGSLYKIEISGGSNDGTEGVAAKFDLDQEKKSIAGEADLKTKYLADYWDYYLDEIFSPWKMKAKEAAAKIKFTLKDKLIVLDGNYQVTEGQATYGKIHFKTNARVRHEQKLSSALNKLRAEIELDNYSLLFGKVKILEKGQGRAVADQKEIVFKQLSGKTGEDQFELAGKYVFDLPRELRLKGSIGKDQNDLVLKLLTENQAAVSWSISGEVATLDFDASVSDIKNMVFTTTLKGQVNLDKVPGTYKMEMKGSVLSLEAGPVGKELFGRLGLSGNLSGRLDDINTWNGQLGFRFTNLKVLNLPPANFLMGIRVKDGLFEAGIPELPYYKGVLSGAIKANKERWGVGILIDNCDIAELGETSQDLAGMKGILTLRLAGTGDFKDLASIKGGGYLKVINCDLREAPIFEAATEGIKSVTHGFIMPDFKRVESNFSMADSKINFQNAYCEAENLDLIINGDQYFSGKSDFTVGVRFFKKGFLNTMRIVFFPITLGIDAVADAIRVKVNGVWPDLDPSASIEPMAWFNRLFGPETKFDPELYTLDKVWEE